MSKIKEDSDMTRANKSVDINMKYII